MEKYWLVLIPNTDEAFNAKSHIIFGTIQELISYATSKNELIENDPYYDPYCYFSHVLGVDGKEHPEILEIIWRKLEEMRDRIENSPFKKLKGLLK